jgi:competence protein ComEC
LLASFLALWFRPGKKWCRLSAHAAVILCVWMYAAIVGLEPPALRAAVVATLMIVGAWFGRKPDPLTILALTLGSMAFVQPQMVESVGFWLSAAASWALRSSMTTQQPAGLRSAFRDMITGVMAANIATLPIIMWTFGEWSPISPVANLLVGLAMIVTFPATYAIALLGIISPTIAAWAAWIPAIGLDLTIAIVERLAPLLPLMQLPIHGPSMAVVVAAPCFAALALLSRDGARWIKIVDRQPYSRVLPSRIIFSGALVGGMAAVLLATLFR